MKKHTASIHRTLIKKAVITTAVYAGIFAVSYYAGKTLRENAMKND